MRFFILVLFAALSISPSLQAQSLKVMTFNILEGGTNGLDRIFDVIQEHDPDIVLVQETSTLNDDFASFAATAGYNYVQNDLNLAVFEPALLSKYPIVESTFFPRVIAATIEIAPGNSIKVYNAHLPPLGLNAERIYQIRHLVWDHLRQAREAYPVLVGGDFNAWSNQTEILGQLTDLGFARDGHNSHLDYIYSFGLDYIPNSEQVLGVTGGSATWPSDHKAIVVEYTLPNGKVQESQSFTLKNDAYTSYTFSSDDFSSHFPLGNLASVEIVETGTKGQLLLNGQAISAGARIAFADLANVVYENRDIGRDAIEWRGYTASGPASTSSYIYLENTGVIGGFDRSNRFYDIAILDTDADLYFGNADRFSTTSEPALLGAEFVKFPTYALLATFSGHADRYADFYTLNLDSEADLYVAFDDRFVGPPAWLTSHYMLTDIAFSSNRHSYKVYKRKTDPGPIAYGQNNLVWERRHEQSHFIFLAVPRNTALEVSLSEPQHEAIDIEPSPLLSWHAAPAATEYDVEVATDALFANTLLHETSSVSTLPLHDLDFGNLYFWRVRARNASSTGAWSPTYAFTTQLPDTAPPRQSADLRGQGIIYIEDGAPLLATANPAAYQVTDQSLTVEAWAKFETLPPHRDQSTILIRPYENEPWEAYHLRVGNFDDADNPVLESLISDGTPNWGYARSGVYTDAWIHIAMAYDGSTVNLYINGERMQSNAYNRSLGSGVRGFYVGGRIDWDNFQGWIDEVRLWDYARTQEEISATRYARLRGNEPGLLGYWPLDEAIEINGVRATPDVTPNANHLRLGDVQLVAETPLDTRPAPVAIEETTLHDGLELDLSIYPNPTAGSADIQFSLQQTDQIEIRLFDVMGRQVLERFTYVFPKGNHAISLELSTLASGLYFAHVTTQNGTQTQTLILMK